MNATVSTPKRDRLIARLIELSVLSNKDGDKEGIHSEADQLLLDYLDDDGIKRAYDAIKKWYA